MTASRSRKSLSENKIKLVKTKAALNYELTSPHALKQESCAQPSGQQFKLWAAVVRKHSRSLDASAEDGSGGSQEHCALLVTAGRVSLWVQKMMRTLGLK